MRPPLSRRQTKRLAKTVAKMGLGRETALTGDAGQRLRASQQLFGPFEPQPQQIAVGRAAETLAEHAGKVILAQPRLLRQLCQRDRVGQMSLQILLHPFDHHGRQPAA